MRKSIMDREILESVGIDYDEAIERFSGAVELFESFLDEMATNNVLSPLQKAVVEGDILEAFRIAHTLKGNFGNLSVKPLYKTVSLMVDVLKNGDMLSAQKLYIELEGEYTTIAEAIKKAI
jgi:HPt (histidine-containing phosphotransfer) domain-containing protein